MKDRVLIAAGGTGGHIYPGLAIAEALRKSSSQFEVHFVGSRTGMENRIIPQAGYALHPLSIGPLHRTAGLKAILKTAFGLPYSFFQSWLLIRKYKPKFVLGVGGYASGPVLFIASLLGYRTYIWEPNAMPGMANRWLGHFVDEAFVVFKEAGAFLRCKKVSPAGMPLRELIEESAGPSSVEDREKFRVFVFGGSQGARQINLKLSEALIGYPELREQCEFVHQTGRTDYEKIKAVYEAQAWYKNGPVQVLEYVNDMEKKYLWADLVICRAGTGTLSELAVMGKASVLIPYPYAADNHQQKNAEVLVNADAAEMILHQDLTAESLRNKILELKENGSRRLAMIKAIKQFHQPRAAQRLVEQIVGQL